MKSREQVGDEESIPHECFCPITQEIMEDPVMAQDGHTYERAAIKEWFDRGHRNSPKTGVMVLSTELTSNHAMRSLIQDLKAILPVLARHQLNEKNIEAAIRLREEEMQLMLEEKGNLLNQEQEKRSELEKELEILRNKTAQLSLKPVPEKETSTAESKLLLQLLQAQQLQMQKQTELMEKMQQRIEQLESRPINFLPAVPVIEREKERDESKNKNVSQEIKSPLISTSTTQSLKAPTLAKEEPQAIPLKQALKDYSSETLLRASKLRAAKRGDLEAVKWLLSSGASLREKYENSRTALRCAAQKGDLEAVKWLLGNGASLSDTGSPNDTTAFLEAAYEGHLEVVSWLLSSGSSVSEKSKDGMTALMFAALKGHLEVVRLLLSNGASLSEKDTYYGMTAFMFAASQGHLEVVRWLLANGSSLGEKDKHGQTALDIAIKPEVKEFLRSYRSPQSSSNPSSLFGNQSHQPALQQGQHKKPGANY